jgi:CheY-like chemotaxis protein
MPENRTDKATILIVDDDESAVEMLHVYLTGHGYQTRKVYSGREGLALIEEEAPHASGWRPWSIDLILLDIMMPGIDGYKVCLRIKDDPALQHIPVIMVTALNSSRDKTRAVSFGADGYITKPYLSEELAGAVESALRTKARQEALLRRQAELEILTATATSAHRSLNLPILISSALTTLLECPHIEAAAIYIVDEATNNLILAQAQGTQGVPLPTIPSCDLGQGVIGKIGNSQQGQWFEDITVRPDFTDRPASPMRAYVGVALRVNGHTVGVLEVFHRQPNWFDGRDIHWLDELGQQLGLAIANANRFERTQSILA